MLKKQLILLSLVSLFLACNNTLKINISGMKCQDLSEPVGIGEQQPMLSWKTESNERNDKQTAYQVIVADNKQDIDKNKGSVWDSGKIGSAKPYGVAYNGKALLSSCKYYWKVRVWGKHGKSGYSPAATFTTAILNENEWQAKWIGEGLSTDPDNKNGFYYQPVTIDANGDSLKYNANSLLLRKQVEFSKPVKSATINVCGLGLYELSINGKGVGDKILNPAKTNYTKMVLYDTYDVTGLLHEGKNAIGIMLGNGWFNPTPKWWNWRMQWHGEKRAMLQMQLIFEDGASQMLITDGSWKIAEGPVRHNCIYDGETYDATKEIENWDTPGFDDSSWKNAREILAPKGMLMAQEIPAIKKTEVLKPASIKPTKDGKILVDFGQNFTGWARIKLHGAAAGDSIVLRYAEQEKDGELDCSTNRDALMQNIYIAKGGEKKFMNPGLLITAFSLLKLAAWVISYLKMTLKGL